LPGQSGELFALAANGAEDLGGVAGAAAHRIGGTLHVADHRRKIGLDKVYGLADRDQPGTHFVARDLRKLRGRLRYWQPRCLAACKDVHEFWKHE